MLIDSTRIRSDTALIARKSTKDNKIVSRVSRLVRRHSVFCCSGRTSGTDSTCQKSTQTSMFRLTGHSRKIIHQLPSLMTVLSCRVFAEKLYCMWQDGDKHSKIFLCCLWAPWKVDNQSVGANTSHCTRKHGVGW